MRGPTGIHAHVTTAPGSFVRAGGGVFGRWAALGRSGIKVGELRLARLIAPRRPFPRDAALSTPASWFLA